MSPADEHSPTSEDQTSPSAERLSHLWTPWRMPYVAGGTREEGCIFCNRLASDDDVCSLILHRGQRAFVIMNLFPYNTGHLMIVPNAHVASPEDADVETLLEMTRLRPPALRALRRALGCDGFNLGLNVGPVAGAGVSEHLHEHVVPRWQGDANFMPILAATKVMPELVPVTYAKVRAELARELTGADTASSVIVSADGTHVLVDEAGAFPRVAADEGEPLWRAALRDVHARGVRDAELSGWAGPARADAPGLAFLVRAPRLVDGSLAAGHHLVDVAELPTSAAARIALERCGEPFWGS